MAAMFRRSPVQPQRPIGFIEPCLPTNSQTVPTGPQWAYEIKHDGFRFICRREGDRVRVFSRNGRDWTDRVPHIVDALSALRVKSITIDGEGVSAAKTGYPILNAFELPLAAWARVMLSYMPPTSLRLTAQIFGGTHGKYGG
jgi:ATP-dependent DNA ligase